jgi:hypothetical protein
MDIQIDKTYYNPLSKLFNYAFFQKICKNDNIDKEKELLELSGILKHFKKSPTYSEIISLLYLHFKDIYRCEYIYKNEVIKEIYKRKKQTFKDVVILNEFGINFSKADFLAVNGHVTIYEIKTDLDSLSRLDGQIEDYLKVAQYVNIVTSPKFVKELSGHLPSNVGILVFNEKNKLEVYREAILNINIDMEVVFSCLNSQEHRKIIYDKHILVPQVPNTQFYSTYLSLFKEIEINEAYDYFIQQLKNRRQNQFNPVGKVQNEMLCIAMNQRNNISLENFLKICSFQVVT